tara:strand:+ start:180 stop:512 length:333 start_codon:yes stop_codon:yes gene_type:complete
MNLHIDQMILYKGDDDLEYGIAKAFLDHSNGRPTKSEHNPILVRWINEEKKYLVVDGYHRVVKYLIEGKRSFRCKIDWFGKKSWWIPPKSERFVLREYLTNNDLFSVKAE